MNYLNRPETWYRAGVVAGRLAARAPRDHDGCATLRGRNDDAREAWSDRAWRRGGRAVHRALSAARRGRGRGDRSAAAGGRRIVRQCRHAQSRHRGADRAARHAAQGAGLVARSAWSAVGAAELFPPRGAVAAALDRIRTVASRDGDLRRDARAASRDADLLEGTFGSGTIWRADPPGRAGAGV